MSLRKAVSSAPLLRPCSPAPHTADSAIARHFCGRVCLSMRSFRISSQPRNESVQGRCPNACRLRYCDFVRFASVLIHLVGTGCFLARYSPSPRHNSPVKRRSWPNLQCIPSVETLLSLWGKEIALQEETMAAQQTSPQSLKSITGAILLALGFLILFANLDGATGQITSAVGTSPEPAQGMLPALALATLHVLQDYAFDHAGFLSGLLQILVSFWPLILIVIGAVLLRDVFWGRFAAYKAGACSSAMGER